jgi:hypothetical protein
MRMFNGYLHCFKSYQSPKPLPGSCFACKQYRALRPRKSAFVRVHSKLCQSTPLRLHHAFIMPSTMNHHATNASSSDRTFMNPRKLSQIYPRAPRLLRPRSSCCKALINFRLSSSISGSPKLLRPLLTRRS